MVVDLKNTALPENYPATSSFQLVASTKSLNAVFGLNEIYKLLNQN
jgi:hypothetical protein